MSIQHYPARRDDPAYRRHGTFSYLPPLSREQMLKQVEYALGRGWTCSVEHVEHARSSDTYWYLWKLPFFGEMRADSVMAEVEECARECPHDLVRVVAYDRLRQTQGLSFVAHRP